MTKKEDFQGDLFIANLIDVSPKGESMAMEHPFYSLSKRPDTTIYRYENPERGAWVEVIPSVAGRATIFDKDLLLYTLGQLMEALNRGQEVSPYVSITAYNFLKATCRDTSGRAYKAIDAALTRLKGTTIKTNITIEGSTQEHLNRERTAGWSLIDDFEYETFKGKMVSIRIKLSERSMAALLNRQVLTYTREYFELTSPFARRMYEICRKHCGRQPLWEIGLAKLYNKFGSKGTLREFRRSMKGLIEAQNVPGYWLELEKTGKREILTVVRDKTGDVKRIAENG